MIKNKKKKPNKASEILRSLFEVLGSFVILYLLCKDEDGTFVLQGLEQYFYVFYSNYGVGISIQELSTSHFNVDKWQTSERMDAIYHIFPAEYNQDGLLGTGLLGPYGRT